MLVLLVELLQLPKHSHFVLLSRAQLDLGFHGLHAAVAHLCVVVGWNVDSVVLNHFIKVEAKWGCVEEALHCGVVEASVAQIGETLENVGIFL